MSEPKFTKGPWKLYRTRLGGALSVLLQSAGGKNNLARIWLSQGCAGEGEANAHLIAAAPEMYNMLDEARTQIVCVCKLNPLVGKPVPCETCRIDAILKSARGEAQ